jgi:hypothetical protein
MSTSHPPLPPGLSPQDAALAQALAAQAPPGFAPPSMTDPNYAPPDRGPLIVAVTIAFTVLAVVTVALRLFLRVFHRSQKVKWDDYLIVPATVRPSPQNPKPFLLADRRRTSRSHPSPSPS